MAWGMTAFGTTSFMLGMYETGLLDRAGVAIILPAAFFFGGIVEVIVAVLEVQRGNSFEALFFGTYGPFWIIYAAMYAWFLPRVPEANTASGVSLFLAMWAVVTAYLFIASWRIDAVLSVILALIFGGLVLLAIGEGAGSALFLTIGGWFTLAFGVLSWYHAASDVISSTFGRRWLPIGRTHAGPIGVAA